MAGCHSGVTIENLTPKQVDNFWKKVDQSGDCWVWVGFANPSGYGVVNINRQLRFAHRVAMAIKHGSLPASLVVMHSCDNRLCVRWEHLELGTQAENMRDRAERGRTVSGLAHFNRKKTHCPSGHGYTEENTFIDKRGWRLCRACRKASACG